MDCFIGEIRLMAFPLAPSGWAYCQGQLLSISQNELLFKLLGTTYGGDGQTTFALPDLRQRVVVGAGQGPGLSRYVPGQQGGEPDIAIQEEHLPAHTHEFVATLATSDEVMSRQPAGRYPTAASGPAATPYSSGGPTDVDLSPAALPANTLANGSGMPHENRQPLLALSYAIALQGTFPTRS